jgi:hypothetical protein
VEKILSSKHITMKALSIFKPAASIAALSLILMGCQKEPLSPNENHTENLALASNAVAKQVKQQERPLKGDFATTVGFIPDWAGGYNPTIDPGAPAWYPGSGEGNLTHLGLSYTFINQHVVPTGALIGEGTTPPVNDYFKAQLAKYNLTVPDEVGWIFLDKHGNSIWSRGTLRYWSPQDNIFRINADGEFEIIGGTGRFESAKGQFAISGYGDLNFVTFQSPFSFSVKGVIVY